MKKLLSSFLILTFIPNSTFTNLSKTTFNNSHNIAISSEFNNQYEHIMESFFKNFQNNKEDSQEAQNLKNSIFVQLKNDLLNINKKIFYDENCDPIKDKQTLIQQRQEFFKNTLTAFKQFEEIAKLNLKNNTTIKNIIQKNNKYTNDDLILLFAINNRGFELIKYLIQNFGLNINSYENAFSFLKIAIINSSYEILKYLIYSGFIIYSNPEKLENKNKDLKDLLKICLYLNKYNEFKILLENNFNSKLNFTDLINELINNQNINLEIKTKFIKLILSFSLEKYNDYKNIIQNNIIPNEIKKIIENFDNPTKIYEMAKLNKDKISNAEYNLLLSKNIINNNCEIILNSIVDQKHFINMIIEITKLPPNLKQQILSSIK